MAGKQQEINDLIDQMDNEISWIMKGKSPIRPFKTKGELKMYCRTSQPKKKEIIPDVVQFFSNKFKLR